MEQKFVKFEEAVAKLGVSPERLNQLREDGQLRAYRDGASWKFRADEIDRLVVDGLPEPPPPSDVSLVDKKDLVEPSPLEGLDELDELELADDDLSLGSELELSSDQDDTVTAGASDPALNIHGDDVSEGSDPSDSILLSEEELGESVPAASTIIGRNKAKSTDDDLQLASEDDLVLEGSDVELATGASNVLSSGVAGSGVLDELEKGSGATSAFENLEEIELDLAAESSRVLTPSDMAKAKEKGSIAKQPAPADSDLTLDEGLAGDDEGTDPLAEIDLGSGKATKSSSGASSDLDLATDEDFVLAEAGGSDITLDSGDSGINLISPSDSGLALDDIPLEMGGSAILESLNLGGGKGESDLSLIGSDTKLGEESLSGLSGIQTDDDFRLTPLGEQEEDGDSSSQVIALDADLGDLGAAGAGILGDDAFAEVEDDGVVLSEDYGEAAVGGLEMAAYGGATAARADSEYSLWNILGLGSCMALLLLATILSLDMVRNIWSWEDNLSLNDSLLESIGGLFGLR